MLEMCGDDIYKSNHILQQMISLNDIQLIDDINLYNHLRTYQTAFDNGLIDLNTLNIGCNQVKQTHG